MSHRCPMEYAFIFDFYSQYSCVLYVTLSTILFYYKDITPISEF